MATKLTKAQMNGKFDHSDKEESTMKATLKEAILFAENVLEAMEEGDSIGAAENMGPVVDRINLIDKYVQDVKFGR